MSGSQLRESRGGTLRALTNTAVLLAALLAGCVGPAWANDCPPKRTMRVPDPIQPLNLDEIKKQLRTYHDQNYNDDVAAVVSDAREWIESRANGVKKPALVLDIDETSLSNWENLLANDLGFIEDGSCERLPRGPAVSRLGYCITAIGPLGQLIPSLMPQELRASRSSS